ncbi:MAG: hypothetical protein ABI716_01045 [Candidatus Saccharibacteria bacterium]
MTDTKTKPDYTSDRGPWLRELFAAKGQTMITVGFTIYEESAPTVPLRVDALIFDANKAQMSGIDIIVDCRARFTFPNGHSEVVRGDYNPLTGNGWFNRTT